MLVTEPDQRGYFGAFGGRFVPETLTVALDELQAGFEAVQHDASFQSEFETLLRDYVGRATPLFEAGNLTRRAGGARIFLKREDLNHTGAHKINNALGQVLLAKRLGKSRVIAETGAGQHGVATATAAALLGMPCRVYMGARDVERQRPNVQRMRLLGAEIVAVESGSKTLKDAINEAMRAWITELDDTHYVVGSVVGPHPFPVIVRTFQSVIGRESRRQCLERFERLPDIVAACVGGGSNAMGMFHSFLRDETVQLVGVEAAGSGVESPAHAASVSGGAPGVLHGARSMLLQDRFGQVRATHSISAGLDYPGVGPEHAYLAEIGRVSYAAITDDDAVAAFRLLAECEGIIPALESAHAIAFALQRAADLTSDKIIVVNLSGRGDKDLGILESLS